VTPSFSIVIPTYSRPVELAQCLESLSRLEYPRDRFEVIVVDDGSAMPLDEVVAPFRSRLTLSLLRQPNAGPAAARNAGAERARGEFLAFTDDDCLPEPGWLQQLAEVLAHSPECMVGGATVNAASENLCSATSQLITDVVYRHYNAVPLRARFLASNNLALSAAGFREIGGFDSNLRTAEDRDLCDRWLHRSRRIIYHPSAGVRHARRLNAWSFCRQHFRYGRGAAYFHHLRALRRSGSLLAESRFHLNVGNWLWRPLMAVRRRQIVPVAVLLMLWQAANLAGFMWETVRRGTDTLRHGAVSLSR
jgi:glycosyltransferase involved in cell wall biosynthesis